MPKLDLLSSDYPTKSIDQNQCRLINMYLQPDKQKGKYPVVAYPMPGLTAFCTTGEANVRTMREYNGVLYVVAGNKFGSVNSGGTFTQLGSNLSTSSGFAQISVITGGSDINNQVVVIDGTNGYSYNIDTSTATFPISDVDFPDTAVSMTSQDDYIMVVSNNSIQYNISNLADSTTWQALDFASKIGYPDNLVAMISHKTKVWLFGTRTTEVWFNSGNASFPFERISDISLNWGLGAKESLVMANDTLHLLAQSKSGGYKFMQIVDYGMAPLLGADAYEALINAMTTVSDCRSYTYLLDGHEFIDWTFPTENITFTYDVTTGVWVTRQSYISSAYNRFLGNCASFCYNKSLIGDYNSGVIYTQSSSVYTENGTAIRRMFISPPIPNEGRRIYVHRLQVEVETNVGSSKTFDLDISHDSGRTWETVETFTIPSDNTTQLYTSSLGSDFNWMFRISTTMNAKFMLLGLVAEFTLGAN